MAAILAGFNPIGYIADILGASEPALRLLYTVLLGKCIRRSLFPLIVNNDVKSCSDQLIPLYEKSFP